MNSNIRKLMDRIAKTMDAIAILQDVSGCEDEVEFVSHRVRVMCCALIDLMTNQELAAAIAQQDEATQSCYQWFIDPYVFNYLKRYRSKALCQGEKMRQS